MNLINDGIGLLLGLAPVAALVALVLAGLALRNQGSVLQNGRFGQWMFWAPLRPSFAIAPTCDKNNASM